MQTCPDCGCRVYALGCVNCHEADYIERDFAEEIMELGDEDMSYTQFQQRCASCSSTWNAEFGLVGTTVFAAPPKVCPFCKSPAIERHADGWEAGNPKVRPADATRERS